MILHIDMDAFFASIEQAINPKLKGKPLIVGSRNNRLYTVVCAASYEAKAYGIDSGMPTKEAFKLCPNLEFVAAEQSKYIWTSEQIYQMLQGYGFEVIYASIDEFRMDIDDEPDPINLTQHIRTRIQEAFGITASIGIAKNSLLAKLASKLNKPNGYCWLTQKNLTETLAKISVDKLCGVGEKLTLFFNALGIKTCLDLYQKTADFLKQNLGKNGLNLYQSLQEIERLEAIAEDSKPKSIGHSYTLPRASENTGFIQAWIRLLCEMVARRLREQNLAAKTIHLWLDGPEIGHFGEQKSFQQPTDDGEEIYLICLKIMAKSVPKIPRIRALGVTGSSLFEAKSGLFLFKEQERREGLKRAQDSINSRFGEWSIYPAIINLTKKLP